MSVDSETIVKELSDVLLGKKTYVQADSYSEAVELAPDGVEVQEGPQGGFYYDGSDDTGSDEEPDSGESDGAEDESEGIGELTNLESEYGGWTIDTDKLDMEAVESGDMAYIEHPSGDYIIEVDDVLSDGEGDFKLTWTDNSGSQREIRSDTKSQFIGVVTDPPSLGETESIDSVGGPDDVEEGDIVYWQDPGGSPMFSRVMTAGSKAIAVETGDSLGYNDVRGKVVDDTPPEPDEKYNVEPDTPGYRFAEAVIEGYMGNDRYADQLVSVKDIFNNIGSVEDINLVKDMIEMELEGRASKSALKNSLEPRYRALGGDMEDIYGPKPDHIPDIRQGTDYERHTTGDVVAAAGRVATRWNSSMNTEAWSGLFDSMTQYELKTALTMFAGSKVNSGYSNKSVMAFEGMTEDIGDLEDLRGSDRKDYEMNTGNFAPLFSRMEKDTAIDALREIQGEVTESKFSKLKQYGQTWAKTPEARQAIKDEFGGYSQTHDEWLFEEDFSKFQKGFFEDWTTMDSGYSVAKALFADYGPNAGANPIIYVKNGAPIGGIEPGEVIEGHFDKIREETQKYYEQHEVPTLFRGVGKSVTSHGTADSWTSDRSTAKGFDGHAVLEAEADPEDLFTTHKVAKARGWYDVGYGSEYEYVVFGGAFE